MHQSWTFHNFGVGRIEAADGRDYMCELSLISWEFGHATGYGVFSLIPRFTVALGRDSKTPPLWELLHWEDCCILCLNLMHGNIKDVKELCINSTANHSPRVRSRCRLSSWLHVVLIVPLYLHTHGPDLQSILILLNATPRMAQWGGNDSWLLYFMSSFANAGKSNTAARRIKYILKYLTHFFFIWTNQ